MIRSLGAFDMGSVIIASTLSSKSTVEYTRDSEGLEQLEFSEINCLSITVYLLLNCLNQTYMRYKARWVICKMKEGTRLISILNFCSNVSSFVYLAFRHDSKVI